jgi:hypothetical protein
MREAIGMTRKKLARLLARKLSPNLRKEIVKNDLLKTARKQEKARGK